MKKSQLKQLVIEILINEGFLDRTAKRISRGMKGDNAPNYIIKDPNDALYKHAQKEFGDFDYLEVNPYEPLSREQSTGVYAIHRDDDNPRWKKENKTTGGWYKDIPTQLSNYEFKRMDEIKVNPPGDFETLIQSYANFIKGLERSEMFDEEGNYIPELKKYHEKLKYYSENGNEEQKKVSKFALSFT